MESESPKTILVTELPTGQAGIETTVRRNRWSGLLQAAVGLSALGFVFARTNFGDVARAVAHIDIAMLGWAALLNLSMTYLMAVRWRWLLRVKYPSIGSGLLFRHYLIGLFFNLFTPGAVGGDLSRLIGIGAITGDRGFVFATLVLERLIGLSGLILAGLGGVYFGRGYLDNPAAYYAIAAVMLVGLMLSGAMFSQRATRLVIGVVLKFEKRFKRRLASEAMARLAEQLAIFGRRRALIAAGIIFTFVIRLVWVLSCWVVAHALGLAVPFSILMAFIAIVDIARMAPISLPNGLGVREYLLVLLLKQVGVSTAEAILFSLIAYTLLMLNGIIGGLLYTARGAAHAATKK